MTKALDGMRVLDISQYESGPACAQLLAWYGADVVQVSPPFEVNATTYSASKLNETALHLANNNNKKSVLIDLSTGEGQELIHRLVPAFDVVVENFAFGIAEKFRLDYATLKALNPGLIYCAIKGFGLTGKYRGYRAVDNVAQAAGGGMSLTGEVGGPPLRAGYLVGDSTAGLSAVSGVLAAYVQKLRTGEGQLVEVSMQEAILHMVRSQTMRRHVFPGAIVPRTGNRITSPTDLYPCAGGGPNDYIHLTSLWDRLFHRLANAIGKPHLIDDPRYFTADDRRMHGDELWAEVAQWTVGRTKWEAMDHLATAGVPVSAVFDTHDIYENEHLAERGAVVSVHHPKRGTIRLPGPPVRLHGSDVPIVAPPLLGELTREVLAAELGLGVVEIDALVARRVIAEEVALYAKE